MAVNWQRLDLPDSQAFGTLRGTDHTVEIERRHISEELAKELDAIAEADGWHVLDSGDYTVLRVDGQTMMSDVACERETCEEAVEFARGDVLIAGLGLGMILPPILAKPEVKSVTVLEISPLVCQLVAPFYQHPQLDIIVVDVFDWVPPQSYDFIWFDIWPKRLESNRSDMAILHARYRRYLNRGGTMRSWIQDQLKAKKLILADIPRKHFYKTLSRRQRERIWRDFARMLAMEAYRKQEEKVNDSPSPI